MKYDSQSEKSFDTIENRNDNEKFCFYCGNIIKIEDLLCPICGKNQVLSVTINGSSKSWLATFLLCQFFGFIGLHRFYVGKIASGILMFFFGWATLGIWWLIDWISILSGKFKDSKGKIIPRS